jgi:hypothetical protein
MKMIMVLISTLMMAGHAYAQDVGVQVGMHNTTASYSGYSDSAELGFKVGLLGSTELVKNVKFRTGLLYTTRNFKLETPGTTIKLKPAYIDIPVLFQYNFNDMFGLYAGPVAAINVGKKLEVNGVSGDIADVKSLYLLAEFGANFMFDMIGFDVYYQMGLGDISDNGPKDYKTYGANFIYLF